LKANSYQNVALYAARLAPRHAVTQSFVEGRYAWVQVARGSLTANGERLQAGDGAAIAGETRLTLEALEPAEVLVFDLA
jgi:hypothetical protein